MILESRSGCYYWGSLARLNRLCRNVKRIIGTKFNWFGISKDLLGIYLSIS